MQAGLIRELDGEWAACFTDFDEYRRRIAWDDPEIKITFPLTFKSLFDVGELPLKYRDWDIVHHLEGTFKDTHPGDIHHEHAYERIIAKKSSNILLYGL